MNLFAEGGPLFMSILTIILLALIYAAWKFPDWVKEIGLLGLAFGILGQVIGLYEAFNAIASMGDVSQAMLAGGLKVTSISTIYGLLIYILSLVIRIIIKPRLN